MSDQKEITEKLVEKPGYWAVIPANVRYDKNLSPLAKLLYGEISCLLQFNNKCFASNKYFSRLYEVSETQVSRLINQLIKHNYVKSEMEITAHGSRRLIKIPLNIFDDTTQSKNGQLGLNINGKHNNHSNNNKPLSKDKGTRKPKDFVPPTEEEVILYFKENGYSRSSAVTAFKYYNVADWKDASGKPVKNWKQKMISVWFKPEHQSEKTEEVKTKISL